MELEEIKQLNDKKGCAGMIEELKNGRSRALPNIEEIESQIDPSKHKVMDRKYRKDKWVKNDESNPYENNGVIDVDDPDLHKKGNMHIVEVERVTVAFQKLIVEMAVAFSFGNAVNYKVKELTDSEKKVYDAALAVLKDIKSRSKDRKIGRTMFKTTEVAELWYVKEEKNSRYGFDSNFRMKCSIFSPLNGDTLYPYFDEYGDMIAFSREYAINVNGKKKSVFETYTDEKMYKWINEENGWTEFEGYPKENKIGKIPIVYGCQDETEWATVQPNIERLELLLSNFADTNDYHGSPKMFVTGDIEGWSDKGDSGAVIKGEPGTTAQYLSWDHAPESVKAEIETLLKLIYSLSRTPDISFDNVKGLGSVSGVALKLLFMDADLKVLTKQEVFDEYFQRRMSIIQSFLSIMNGKDEGFKKACSTLVTEPTLQPYMIEDEASKVATLMSATGQNPIASQKTAISSLGWVNDVDGEIEQINEESGAAALEPLFNQEPTK